MTITKEQLDEWDNGSWEECEACRVRLAVCSCTDILAQPARVIRDLIARVRELEGALTEVRLHTADAAQDPDTPTWFVKTLNAIVDGAIE